jgi:uncharacterized protein
MKQRLTVVTLGVKDKGRARAFYEALGWHSDSDGSGDDPVFFQCGDMVVALWDHTLLAEDSGVEDTGGWGGITLAHNVASRQEVDAITDVARTAGATVAREPAETFWGGYTDRHRPRRTSVGDRPQSGLAGDRRRRSSDVLGPCS